MLNFNIKYKILINIKIKYFIFYFFIYFWSDERFYSIFFLIKNISPKLPFKAQSLLNVLIETLAQSCTRKHLSFCAYSRPIMVYVLSAFCYTIVLLGMHYALSALRDVNLSSLPVMDKKLSQSPLQMQSLLFSPFSGLKVAMNRV